MVPFLSPNSPCPLLALTSVGGLCHWQTYDPKVAEAPQTGCGTHSWLGGRFGYFLFFLLGGGEGGSEAPGRGGGRLFLLKIPRGGGVSQEGGEGRGGCLWEI